MLSVSLSLHSPLTLNTLTLNKLDLEQSYRKPYLDVI